MVGIHRPDKTVQGRTPGEPATIIRIILAGYTVLLDGLGKSKVLGTVISTDDDLFIGEILLVQDIYRNDVHIVDDSGLEVRINQAVNDILDLEVRDGETVLSFHSQAVDIIRKSDLAFGKGCPVTAVAFEVADCISHVFESGGAVFGVMARFLPGFAVDGFGHGLGSPGTRSEVPATRAHHPFGSVYECSRFISAKGAVGHSQYPLR